MQSYDCRANAAAVTFGEVMLESVEGYNVRGHELIETFGSNFLELAPLVTVRGSVLRRLSRFRSRSYIGATIDGVENYIWAKQHEFSDCEVGVLRCCCSISGTFVCVSVSV